MAASAVLSARHDARGGLLLLSLDVTPEIARTYTAPGQYIDVRTESGNGYFVLASDVGEVPWQLLVKSSGAAGEGRASDVLATLPLGTAVELEGPLGSGFSVERMKDRNVVVAVVVSALGVARPVVRRRIEDGVAGATYLFVGLRRLTDLAIPDEIASWSERGVTVVLCISRSELHLHPTILPRARRVTGYVQHALARSLESGDVPHGTLVIAAGPDEMLADMRALAEGAGGPRAAGAAILAGPSLEVITNV